MNSLNRDKYKEVERQPRRYGKSTFVDNAFLASCEAGQAVIYHHPKYVVLSNKAYENLHSELEKVRQETIETFVDKYYGKRCKDYEEGCPCCDMWKLVDDYLTNLKSK